MKLTVVSDGTPKGTHVINTTTGEKVENVVTCSINHEPGASYLAVEFRVIDTDGDLPTGQTEGDQPNADQLDIQLI